MADHLTPRDSVLLCDGMPLGHPSPSSCGRNGNWSRECSDGLTQARTCPLVRLIQFKCATVQWRVYSALPIHDV